MFYAGYAIPKNAIQLQKGMSLSDHFAQYGSEKAVPRSSVQVALAEICVCPECGNTTYCVIESGKVYQCHKCHKQTSLACGTIFESTKLPLTKWFLAIDLLTQRKKSTSALQLKREIGVSYNTAWSMKHKIMQVMLGRQKKHKLKGRVEVDDAYIGGEREGKTGRGAQHKKPFIAAVETDEIANPRKIHLRAVKGFRTKSIVTYAKNNLTSGSLVVSDSFACFRGFEIYGCRHTVIVCGGEKKGVKNRAFRWVNTMLCNVKNSITGTFHAVSLKHVPTYLAEFECKFNRRFALEHMTERFIYFGLRTLPMPYRILKMAEVHG